MQVPDFTLGERDDSDVVERQPLEDRRGVLHVTAQSIEGLGEHDVVAAAVTQQRLKSWTMGRGARDCRIGVVLNDGPPLAGGERAAVAELVLD